ncbi:hypothetical protein HK102_000634 [Quaeritorhiza haematococci]|nr:hypothetical protein HK102_000634 [Quaeritorhiza haematococci]
MDEQPDFDPNFVPISIPDPDDIPALNAAAKENPELFPYLQAATKWFVELSETSNPAPNLKDFEFELMKRFFLEVTVKLTQISRSSSFQTTAVRVAFQLILQIRFIVCLRGWATRVVERLREVQASDTQNDTNGQAKSMHVSVQGTQVTSVAVKQHLINNVQLNL